MFLPLPHLDDVRWADLVEEGRALIPVYAPEWTDHNLSDPGITLAELLAWVAEMQAFQLDRVPDRHRRKFLSLVGVAPEPPRPARTVVRFDLSAGAPPVQLPATIECEGRGGAGETVRVRTLLPLHVVPARLEALLSQTPAGSVDLTDRWRRGEPFPPLGDDPRPGDALVLRLSEPLPAGLPVSIALTAATDRAGEAERRRLRDATSLLAGRCGPPASLGACDEPPAGTGPDDDAPLEHHSARTVWELMVGPGRWRALDPAAGEVRDDTRALTLDGRVDIVAPGPSAAGGGDRLRCRLVGGAYDDAPSLRDIALNGVAAEQAVPTAARWEIVAGAPVTGTPAPGAPARLGIDLDAAGRVRRLDLGDASAPEVLVLDYRAPGPQAGGWLVAEAVLAGRGDGAPEQSVTLAPAPLDAASLRVWTVEGAGPGRTTRRWSARTDLDASGPADPHLTLDAALGRVRFGDGRRGLVPGPGAAIVAAYRVTRAEAGDLPAGALVAISDDAHDRALLAGAPPALAVTNPVPASGGAPAETLEQAEGRAGELAATTTRAVTLADHERLALGTPGTRLARAAALANTHPAFPCVVALGVVTVVVIPHLPRARPAPSPGLLRAVARQLGALRVVGTRIEVAGPTYTEVLVRARVLARPLADRAQLPGRVAAALDAFLHPLQGGPDRLGWPLGRDVVHAEILRVIDDVAGVDHVLDVALVGPDGPSCGNLCLGPLGLVAAGAHEVEVVAE